MSNDSRVFSNIVRDVEGPNSKLFFMFLIIIEGLLLCLAKKQTFKISLYHE